MYARKVMHLLKWVENDRLEVIGVAHARSSSIDRLDFSLIQLVSSDKE